LPEKRGRPSMGYFSKYFKVSKEDLDAYGAVDISLDCDSNLFIDPCLIYSNDKYKTLHNDIITYFLFLKELKESGTSFKEFSKYCNFHEVCYTWLGYSKESNKGTGLSTNFSLELFDKIDSLFNSKHSDSHIEKIFLFSERTSCDRISDLITNLILDFLCKYTMDFTKKYISDSSKIDTFSTIEIKQENGRPYTGPPKEYILPFITKITKYKNKPPKITKEPILLTPKNIVRVKNLELNNIDFKNHYNDILKLIDDDNYRNEINKMFDETITKMKLDNENKMSTYRENKIKRDLFYSYAQNHTEILDYYLKFKEIPENLKQTQKISNEEFQTEMAKTNFLAINFLEKNNINEINNELPINDFIDMIKKFFIKNENNINRFNLKSEKDLDKFFNHISFNVYGISSTKIKKKKLLIKFSRNFAKKDKNSTAFNNYLNGNYKVILFCSSEENKKDLLEFLKLKKIYTEIDKSIFIIDYFS